MPTNTFSEYTRQLARLLNALLDAPDVSSIEIQSDIRSDHIGFISGFVNFENDSQLHFREYINLSLPKPLLMYSYHYQDQLGKLIFRYDNAAHRPTLPQAEHKHIGEKVILVVPPNLSEVINEARDWQI